MSSVKDDTETVSFENFGVVYYDAICNPMSLYILHIEISARIYINLMRKNVLNALIESASDRKDINIYKKTFSREFICQTCCYERLMVKYLNLSVSVDQFCYVFHNFKKTHYNSFLRIYNYLEDQEE